MASVENVTRMIQLSQGNPGALTVFSIVQREHLDHLPDLLDALEQHQIYGSEIWVIYKNKCDKEVSQFLQYPFHQYGQEDYRAN